MLPPEPVARPPDPDFLLPDLSPAQRAAADALRATVSNDEFSVTLVDGVTGAGKTEVYFEAVAQAVQRGRQSLILMPEIALTARFLDRFAARFGVRPGRVAFPAFAAPARAHLGRGRAGRSRGRSSGRARRCSCPIAISA